MTSGNARARAGIGSIASRPHARPLTAIAITQATISAGARLGAAAITAANNSEAVAAAAHDVAAPNAANASQPSSTWASTAPGRPSPSAMRNGGANAHTSAATARTEPRSVSRDAANHAPIAAAGSASSHTSTSANEGAQNVIEPSTASAPAKGSAAPTNPVPMSRHPYAALRQSAASPSESGSSPPPPMPGAPISHARSPTDAATERSSTQPPPVPRNCSSCVRPRALARRASAACWRRRRSSSGCMRSGAMADQPTVRARFSVERARGTREPENIVVNAAAHSPGIEPGALTRSSRTERSNASGRKVIQCSGTVAAGA